MPFDPSLIKITTIGVVFLVLLAFINYTTIGRRTNQLTPPQCDECYRDLDTSRKSHTQKIEELNKEIRDREIQIRILREKDCQSIIEGLKRDNQQLTNRLSKCQNEYKRVTSQFQKCKSAYQKLREIIYSSPT